MVGGVARSVAAGGSNCVAGGVAGGVAVGVAVGAICGSIGGGVSAACAGLWRHGGAAGAVRICRG